MDNLQGFRPTSRAAFRLAGWQILLGLVVATGAGWIGGLGAFMSALMGAGIGVIAGTWQALRMFSVSAADDPARFYRSVWISELVKILLTVALFIVAIRVFDPRFGPMIGAYAATFVVYWLALGTGYPWTAAGAGDDPTSQR